MNKKAIAILGGVFLLIVGVLIFIIIQRSSSEEESDTVVSTPVVTEQPNVEVPVDIPAPDPEPEDPISNSNFAYKLTDDSVVSPILTFRGDGISYFNRQGQLYITDYTATGSEVVLSNKREVVVPDNQNISKVLWPAVGNSYMAVIGSGSNRTFSVYDPNSATYVSLPRQVKSLTWMPGGDKIIFTWVNDDGSTYLNIANPDTTGYQELTDLYEPDNEIVASPNGQLVAFYRTQISDTSLNKIHTVTQDGKTFDTIVPTGYNKGVLWSPDSTKFLFTRYDATTRKPTLWMANVSTKEVKSLGLATTETKAVWTGNSSTVIVAAPSSGTADQGITQDKLYRIDVVSGSQTQIDPSVPVDLQDLFLSLDEQILFFRNAQDNALYYLYL